jgi:hypothetical protein
MGSWVPVKVKKVATVPEPFPFLKLTKYWRLPAGPVNAASPNPLISVLTVPFMFLVCE